MRSLGIALAFVSLLALGFGASLYKRGVPGFHWARSVGHVGFLREASGLAASSKFNNILYSHDDSGGQPQVFMIDATNGRVRGKLTIRGVWNGDWEDIAAGPCPDGGNCIYIGDTGSAGGKKEIIRVKEPSRIGDQSLNVDGIIKYSVPEKDSETLLIDPKGQLYLVAKVWRAGGNVYKIPNWAWGQGRQSLGDKRKTTCTSSANGPVAGDISKKGDEILIKTYGHICYYKVRQGETIMEALSRNPDGNVPYKPERQGEAVAWAANGSGYYTLSEGTNQALYYYQRK